MSDQNQNSDLNNPQPPTQPNGNPQPPADAHSPAGQYSQQQLYEFLAHADRENRDLKQKNKELEAGQKKPDESWTTFIERNGGNVMDVVQDWSVPDDMPNGGGGMQNPQDIKNIVKEVVGEMLGPVNKQLETFSGRFESQDITQEFHQLRNFAQKENKWPLAAMNEEAIREVQEGIKYLKGQGYQPNQDMIRNIFEQVEGRQKELAKKYADWYNQNQNQQQQGNPVQTQQPPWNTQQSQQPPQQQAAPPPALDSASGAGVPGQQRQLTKVELLQRAQALFEQRIRDKESAEGQ